MPIVTRRRKQKGDTDRKKRLEAAVKAILPLGFSRDLISNTLQHLLQVYGGQRGWAFIEEESYKLVVDTILEGEETCSPKAGVLDERETNTEHIDISSDDVKLSQDKPSAEEDTELEGDTAKADKTFAHQECRSTEQVIPTENQPYDISISNGSLTREKENKFGNSNACADGDGALTHKKDIGISSTSEAEIVHHSSNRAGEVDRDVALKISDPLDDSSDSVKAEEACQKGLYVGKTETESLEPSLGCNIYEDNRWQITGEDKVQNSMLAGVQEGFEQKENADIEEFSCLLGAEESEKKEKVEESKKYGALTLKRDIDLASASEGAFVHYSPDRAGEVDRDVGLEISDPLDDSPDSLKAEEVCQKGIYVGKTETESLEPSFGCNIDEDNRWQITGKDKVQNSILGGVQEGLEQGDKVDPEVFSCTSCTSCLPEAEKYEKKEKVEESKKHGKEHGERHCLLNLPKDVSYFSHSLRKTSEPCVIQTTTGFSCSQNTATNSCLKEIVMQEGCLILPEQIADQISGSRGHADSSWTTSLPSSGLQRQEAPLYSSNLHSLPHRNPSLPLKRKACFGWLSDDESSPERYDTARLSNDFFCKVKEIGSDTMTTGKGTRSLERCCSGKNAEDEKNIMLSNEKRLPDRSSSEYDCKRSEEDTRRLADRLFRPWTSLSKDIGDKCIGDKYEQTEAGQSVQKILAKLRHENELYDKANCNFGGLQMDESIGGSRSINASHKLHSSRGGHESYRSNHRNSRIDGKHSWQPTNNNSSYNEKTSPHSLKDYQRGEPRRKDWDNQVRTIGKQHLEQGISRNREVNFREGHYRQQNEKILEKDKIISYNKKETDDQDYCREKKRESVEVVSKPSLPHEKKGYQDPKNVRNCDHGSEKVGEEFHSPNKRIALPHAHFRNDYDALQPRKLRKMSRWDVKSDFIK